MGGQAEVNPARPEGTPGEDTGKDSMSSAKVGAYYWLFETG